MKVFPTIRLIYYNLFILFFIACNINEKQNDRKESPSTSTDRIAKKGMVVSNRKESSEIGVEILKEGGNVFDAMVGIELSLAVSYPYAGSLGSGGFMVFRLKDGEIGALDFREKAPIKASKNMYLDKNGNFLSKKSTQGALSVGVPGTIAGVFAAHEKYGKLPIKSLIEKVIKLAEKGVVITQNQLERLNSSKELFKKINRNNDFFLAKSWKVGDTIKNIPIAKTLKRIRDNGRNEFYEGETAKILVKHLNKFGGIITLDDLKNYKAIWRTPITTQYKGLKFISMPPPSSGGICIAQILGMIEPYDISQYPHNSTKAIQVITEAERRSYSDRAYFLGDPDFTNIPLSALLSKKYAKKRMINFTFEKAIPSFKVAHGKITNSKESDETGHYSIVDSYGNAIAVTTTLNGRYGSKLYCDSLGFFFNNQMDDFVAKPNAPNLYGLIGGEANSIAPQKRMLSSMSPTIIEKNGKLFMTLGAVGGSRIITSVLQTILNVYDFKMNMQEAVNAPHFHHQWLPDEIQVETVGFDPKTLNELRKLGYKIRKMSIRMAKTNGILVNKNQQLEGGYLEGTDDTPVGF